MAPALTRMNPEALPDASKIGYAQISIVPPGPLAFVSGQVAWPEDGSTAPASLAEQTAGVIRHLQAALDALAATPQDIVQMRIYMAELTSETQEIAMTQILRSLDGAQPSLTGVGVTALAGADLLIEIEMVVRVPD